MRAEPTIAAQCAIVILLQYGLFDCRHGAPYIVGMDVTVHIPDDLAARLGSAADLPRKALEALALEEFRLGRLSQAELRRLLGFETRQTLDAFLKAHEIYIPFGPDDLDKDRSDLRRLGF